ncbi:MAG TPA: hypothetical protein VKR24_11475, partial [Candidatus Limnocylindrales bacterium]|nr:hypothetical protein [Candidatus Limnocylindrales bacterium]
AISSDKADRIRLRAAVINALGNSDAHLTTSAEAQAVEERIQQLGELAYEGASGPDIEQGLRAIDRVLLGLAVSAEEWDILFRQRLKIECAYLRQDRSPEPVVAKDAALERTLIGVPVV